VQHTVAASKIDQSTTALTGVGNVTYADTAQCSAGGGSGTVAWSFSIGDGSVCRIDSLTATSVTIDMTVGVGGCDVIATKAADNNSLDVITPKWAIRAHGS
jgi:hypothetical protein